MLSYTTKRKLWKKMNNTILYMKANMVSVCLWWQTGQDRAEQGDQGKHPLIAGHFQLRLEKQQWWCLFVWAVPGRFFQSLPVPCGASRCNFPRCNWLQRKKKSGVVWFFEAKDLVDQKKNLGLGQPRIFFFWYWPRLPFFSFSYCPSWLRGRMKCLFGLMTGQI